MSRAFLLPVAVLAFFSASAHSEQFICPSVVLRTSYLPVGATSPVFDTYKIPIPAEQPGQVASSDASMAKAIFVVQLGNAMKRAITDYHGNSEPHPSLLVETPAVTSGAVTYSGIPFIPMVEEEKDDEKKPQAETREQRISKALAKTLERFEAYARAHFGTDKQVREALKTAEQLVANLAKPSYGGGYGYGGGYRGATRGLEAVPAFSMAAAAPKSLGVRTGGAQDYSHFASQVEDGTVPEPETLVLDGFLKSFSLPMTEALVQTSNLIQGYGIVARAGNQVWVRVGTQTNVTKETFPRRPMNLALVVDISGSMSNKDGTAHTRLEWMKKALKEMLAKLTDRDTVSLTAFDDKADVMAKDVQMTAAGKEQILKLAEGLATRGSTNVGKALLVADETLSVAQLRRGGSGDVEDRMVLLSDCGANEGPRVKELTDLIRTAASHNVSLTAIGIGQNFDVEVARAISESKGGNYLFVKDGEGLFNLFRQFEYLALPAAHDFRVMAEFEGVEGKPKLVGAYGIPASIATGGQLISIPTLFFADTGEEGGAILLVFELPEEKPVLATLVEPAPQ